MKASAEQPLVAAALVAPERPTTTTTTTTTPATTTREQGRRTTGSFPATRRLRRGIVARPARDAPRPASSPLRSVFGPARRSPSRTARGSAWTASVFASAGRRRERGQAGARASTRGRQDPETRARRSLRRRTRRRRRRRRIRRDVRHPKAPKCTRRWAPIGTRWAPPSPRPVAVFGRGSRTPEERRSSRARLDLAVNLGLLKGDRAPRRPASFGSVMRATKEKANAAMAQAKVRIEATMGGATDPGNVV